MGNTWFFPSTHSILPLCVQLECRFYREITSVFRAKSLHSANHPRPSYGIKQTHAQSLTSLTINSQFLNPSATQFSNKKVATANFLVVYPAFCSILKTATMTELPTLFDRWGNPLKGIFIKNRAAAFCGRSPSFLVILALNLVPVVHEAKKRWCWEEPNRPFRQGWHRASTGLA